MENIEQLQQPIAPIKNPLKMWVIVLSILVLVLMGMSIFFIKKINQLSSNYVGLKNDSSENIGDNVVNTPTVNIITAEPTKTEIKINNNYFVFKEWGLKFKIPADLVNIKYVIDGNTAYFVAEPSDQSLHYVNNINSLIKTESMGIITRSNEETKSFMGEIIVGRKIGNYYYYPRLSTGRDVPGIIFGLDMTSDDDKERKGKAIEVDTSLNNNLLETLEATN